MQSSSWQMVKQNILRDFSLIIREIFRLLQHNWWIHIIFIVLLLCVIFQLDHIIITWCRLHQDVFFYKTMRLIGYLGIFWVNCIAIAVLSSIIWLIAHSNIKDNIKNVTNQQKNLKCYLIAKINMILPDQLLEKLKNILFVMIYSTTIAVIINSILKLIFSRMRPYAAESVNELSFFNILHFGGTNQLMTNTTLNISASNINISHFFSFLNSMPSGHTTTVVALFLPIMIYFWPSRMSIIAICAILLVASSRVYNLAHWPSDVLCAMYITALIVTACYNVRKNYT